jgi:hypothetical protein
MENTIDIPVEAAAKIAASSYQAADAETKAMYLRAIAQELGIEVSADARPQLQAALLDTIHQHIGNKSPLHRANFARAVIAVLDMDARTVLSGERQRLRNMM